MTLGTLSDTLTRIVDGLLCLGTTTPNPSIHPSSWRYSPG